MKAIGSATVNEPSTGACVDEPIFSRFVNGAGPAISGGIVRDQGLDTDRFSRLQPSNAKEKTLVVTGTLGSNAEFRTIRDRRGCRSLGGCREGEPHRGQGSGDEVGQGSIGAPVWPWREPIRRGGGTP